MKISNLLWGICFVLIGVIFGLNALEITDIDIFFNGWWTLFIIVPCFIGLFDEDGGKTGDIIGIVIGLCLFFAVQGIIDFSLLWKLMVPVILIIIGLSFIFKDRVNNKVKSEVKKINKTSKGSKEYCSTFSGQKVDYTNEKFDGCELTAVFGGVECDLRDAIIKKDAVVNVTSIFGGVTLYLPQDVNVKTISNSIFGGVSDESNRKNKEGKTTIYVEATCIFGRVELK